jgi:nicotinamide mononucleotide transporter
MSALEIFATAMIIANVYLLTRQSIWNYAFGLAGVLAYGWLFYQYQLYSDTLLQWAFYAPLQVIGAYWWWYYDPDQPDSMPVVRLNPEDWWIINGGILFSAGVVGWLFSHTDAAYPYIDALTSGMSVVATLLLLRKVLENWYIWIAMDLIAIPLYWSRELYLTSALYFVLLLLCLKGLREWRKSMD